MSSHGMIFTTRQDVMVDQKGLYFIKRFPVPIFDKKPQPAKDIRGCIRGLGSVGVHYFMEALP